MTLEPPRPALARRLRGLFERAGFEPQTLARTIGSNEAASHKRQNTALLLHRTEALTPLHILLRWFLIGAVVPCDRAEATLDSSELDAVQECGLVVKDSGGYRSDVLVSPFQGFLLASDRLTDLESGQNPEAVLMVNRTTWRLGRFMLREPVSTTLDLGAGCGALALVASRHSREVVATDLNPRAVQFAKFNAALNGVENVVCLAGDCWQPVAGRRFDRIVCNPPFFLSPDSDSLFCDNPFELDEFCRRLVREAGRRLEQDGVFQMVFEWAEIDGESWKDRLLEWVDGIGCDAWIGHGYSMDAARYSHQRITEKVVNAGEIDTTFEAWSSYFQERGVHTIHGGVLALRQRRGPNWVQIGEFAGSDEAHHALRSRFHSLDYAHSRPTDEELLDSRPKLIDGAELVQRMKLQDGAWRPLHLQLELQDGLADRLLIAPSVTGLLQALTGEKTVRELGAAIARQHGQDPDATVAECARLVRSLAVRGFVVEA